jgi:hypothetical protein
MNCWGICVNPDDDIRVRSAVQMVTAKDNKSRSVGFLDNNASPEDGDSMFSQNVIYLQDHKALLLNFAHGE